MIMANNDFLTLRVDSQKVAAAACENLREAIALTVISNTAEQRSIGEEFLAHLREEAAKFSSSKHIVILRLDEDGRQRLVRRYDYSLTGNHIDTLKSLQQFYQDMVAAWYEDSISFNYDGNSYYGFCWQGNTGGLMVGYILSPPSEKGDWDYAEDQEITDDTTSDTTASTYRTDLAQIINAGAVWNAAHAAYERGIAFDIDAINQMVLDITLLKRDTKSLKVKDMCNQLLARLSEYGFQ